MAENSENTKSEAMMSDDLDVAKAAIAKIVETEEQEELARITDENRLRNLMLAEADLHLFGDRTILAQVTQLVAYIRHAVKNNLSTEITVKIGNTQANAEFMFDANGCVVPDLVTQKEAWIN